MRKELENAYCLHRQSLFTLALTITGCRQLAEDAVHSAFERLCRLQTPPDGDLTSYVFVSVRNAAYDVQRHRVRTRHLRQSMFESGVCPVQDNPTQTDDLLTAERDEILRHAVEELCDRDREILVLKIFGGLTFDAIGEVVQQSAKTVATRYRRALQKLEEKLRGKL